MKVRANHIQVRLTIWDRSAAAPKFRCNSQVTQKGDTVQRAIIILMKNSPLLMAAQTPSLPCLTSTTWATNFQTAEKAEDD
jgi:hypothetical protein